MTAADATSVSSSRQEDLEQPIVSSNRQSVRQRPVESSWRRVSQPSATTGGLDVQWETAVTFSAEAATNSSHSTESLIDLLKSVRAKDPNIQRVHLEGNKRRSIPLPYLVALLQGLAEHPYVSHVTLSRVMGTSANCKENNDLAFVQAAADCLQQSRSLTHLDLSRNGILPAGARLLATALVRRHCALHDEEPPRLHRLNLEGNRLGDKGVQALCRAIMKAPSIAFLKLGRNQLGEASVHALAELVIHQGLSKFEDDTSIIRSLDIRGNHLGASASFLSQALSSDCRLQSLHLSRNDLDATAVQGLAQALQSNTSLRTLDLQHNHKVENRAAAMLCQALQVNHTFRKLKLRHTAVSDGWRKELLEVLLINAHGPELARQTKDSLRQIVAMQRREEQKSLLSQVRRPKWLDCDWSVSGDNDEEGDDTERTTSLEEDDEWMGSWVASCTSLSETTKQEYQECVICCNPPENGQFVALLPCTHHNCCLECGQRLKDCHMCRRAVVKVWPLATGLTTLTDGLYLTQDRAASARDE